MEDERNIGWRGGGNLDCFAGCLDLLACWHVGSWLDGVFGEGPRQNEEIRMWRDPVISGSAGNLRKDPARKRKLRSGGVQWFEV